MKYFSFLSSAKDIKLPPLVLTHLIIKTKKKKTKMKTHSTLFSNCFTILHAFLKKHTLVLNFSKVGASNSTVYIY